MLYKALKRNIRLLYAVSLFANSDFVLPIYLLFGRQFLGLSYLQAGSFLIVSWFVSVALDFVGGGVADKVGRKRAYVYGMLTQIAAITPFLVTKSYLFLLASAAIYGAGKALSSNSLDALIYEQAIFQDAKSSYQRANANMQVSAYVGRIYASALGGMLFFISPRLPYLFWLLAMVAALIAGAMMALPEHGKNERLGYRRVISNAANAYRHDFAALKFIVVAALFALWADMLFSYIQPYFIQRHVSSITLGVLFSAISIISMCGSLLMRKLPDFLHAHTIQSLEILGIIVSALFMQLLPFPWSLAAPFFVALIFGFTNPNIRLYINARAQNHLRASTLSAASTMYNLGSMLGFGLAFYMADHFSQQAILGTVIVGAAVTLVINLLVPDRKTAG